MKYNLYIFKICVWVHQLLYSVKVQKRQHNSQNGKEGINYYMYEYAKNFKHLMVEPKDENRLNHFSHFFPIIQLPRFNVFCLGKTSVFLPSLGAHLHQGAWGAVVHHCRFCWQSLQDKLRAAAFPTASGSGNLCATNCWRRGRLFWRSVTALSYFTFSF